MGRAIRAALLSALIMPGVGQLHNKQVRKTGLMVSASSLLFLIFFALLTTKLWAAIATLDQASPELGPWMAIVERLAAGGLGWLWLMMAIALPLWLYGVIDAFVTGRRLEADERGGPGEEQG